ncbi:MAG: InlB B-repeat-containing protein, partial [Planctomycetota bacterium]
MDSDYTLMANFDTAVLTVSSTSGGIVTSPGEGIFLYPPGTVVAIAAEADPCYVFVEWTGTAVLGGKVTNPYTASTTVTADADYTLVANFRESDYDPNQAWNPSPFNSEMLVDPDIILSWMPGDGIGTKGRHFVYFGTDPVAVATCPSPPSPGPEYQGFNFFNDLDWLIGDVESGKSYYWRIDEGNQDGSITKGNVWGFRTGADIYVDESATGGNNGSSWEDAFNYLQDALSVAEAGDHIWVAEGSYRPDESNTVPDGTGLRTDTFELISGVAIYGAFPAGGGYWHERDADSYETVLSGDLAGDDDGFANNGENS